MLTDGGLYESVVSGLFRRSAGETPRQCLKQDAGANSGRRGFRVFQGAMRKQRGLDTAVQQSWSDGVVPRRGDQNSAKT